jgi:chromosome segregation ATPase
MIDSQLIESAKFIRKDYLSLTKNLNKYQDDVKNLGFFLLKKVDEIRKYNDDIIKKIKTKDDISKVTNHILKEIQDIEDEEKKLAEKVESVNLRLEKLRSDEVILYNTIKQRYPNLTDEQITKEIHSHLDE